MHVVEVIPLKKGVQVESLSYYTADTFPIGSIVDIPIRKKTIPGLVISSQPVSAAKAALRSATFSLRKLPPQEAKTALPTSLISTAREIATTVPAQLGSILFSLLPPDVRSGARAYPQLPDHLPGEVIPPGVLTATKSERYITYRSLIRGAFAHRGSVLFVVPTSAAVAEATELLSAGIEKRVVVIASSLGKRELDKAFSTFEDLSHSKLIITTPNYAFLCRHDLTTIIIENSGSPHFISRSRPYLDARESLKTYARTIGAEVIIGDNVPATEDEIKRRLETYSTHEEHPQRLQLSSVLEISEHPKETHNFSIFTEDMVGHIKRTLDNRGRVFLLGSRRGLAPIVLCKDCGHIFRCPDSGAPYSLLATGKGDTEKRWFYCGTSGRRVPAADICPDCGSWRLHEQGIGIQQIERACKEQFMNAELFLMDHTTATTHKKATKIAQSFYAAKKSILVATSLALPYLTKQIECVGVVSYEAMRSVPTWRADETVFQTLMTLREIANKDVVVQTRTEPDELLLLARKGLVDQFYDGEISVRQSLQYPPFSTFILLTFTGTKEQVTAIEADITQRLKDYQPHFYTGPLSSQPKTIRYGLLRIPSKKYPNPNLTKLLLSLPPYIKIEINPAKII